jgi:Na+/melibiose symporter-like transporter
VGSGKCTKAVPVGNFIDHEHLIHDRRNLDVLVQFAWWLSETVVIVISSIWYFESIEELRERHVDSSSSSREISKSIVCLFFSKNNFITSDVIEITFILPLFISRLDSAIIFPEAWTTLSYEVVIESFCGHISVVTDGNLIIVWYFVRIFAKVIPEGALFKDFLTDIIVDHTSWSNALFPDE